MKRKRWNALVPFLILALTFTSAAPARAERGAPGSAEFGFGALIYPSGPFLTEALSLAVDLDLDWIAVPVAWQVIQPAQDAGLQTTGLDQVMQFAASHGLSVLVSVSGAPAWAQAERGPDPGKTAAFIEKLVNRYPLSVQAVELFPGANTSRGWGAQPAAGAYLDMLQVVSKRLKSQKTTVLLVAGGLQPQSNPVPAGNMDDLVFLRDLYALGAAAYMPVVSVQYPSLTGELTTFPEQAEPRVFRHYEDVRRLMAENNHRSGVIWVTHFSLPSGTIHLRDSKDDQQNLQAAWLVKAYTQARAQLYIGVGFLQSLNPEREGAVSDFPALLQATGVQHSFVPALREMIELNQAGSPLVTPGKAKGGSFGKKRP